MPFWICYVMLAKMGGFLDWFRVQANRVRVFAYFNFTLWTVEMGLYLLGRMVDPLALHECLELSCECLLAFFVLRGMPLILSPLLIFGVTMRHVMSCDIWYLSEFIGIAMHEIIYSWLFWNRMLTAEQEIYCFFDLVVRISGMYVMYDFLCNFNTMAGTLYTKGSRPTIDNLMNGITTKNPTDVSIHQGSGPNITLKKLKPAIVLHVEETTEEDKVAVLERTLAPPREYSECVVSL